MTEEPKQSVQNEPELKPCPFCGQSVTLREVFESGGETGESYGYYDISCPKHRGGVFVGVHNEDDEQARLLWNTRITPPSVSAAQESDAASKPEEE